MLVILQAVKLARMEGAGPIGARTTTSTIFGVSLTTSCTRARGSSSRRAASSAGDGPEGARRASTRLTTG